MGALLECNTVLTGKRSEGKVCQIAEIPLHRHSGQCCRSCCLQLLAKADTPQRWSTLLPPIMILLVVIGRELMERTLLTCTVFLRRLFIEGLVYLYSKHAHGMVWVCLKETVVFV